MSSSKFLSHASYLILRMWLRCRWICTLPWNLHGPELPEGAFNFDTTWYSNVYFLNSTYIIFFLFTWRKLFIFKHLKLLFLHRTWNADSPEVAKVILVQTYLSFSKSTAVSSCIRFWIDAFILLQDCYTEASPVLFLTLVWILPSISPSITFFSQSSSLF